MNETVTLTSMDMEENSDLSDTTVDKFNEKYQLGEKVGEGSNGLVRKCYKKEDKESKIYAVKCMEMEE